eukprot:scaffold12.g8040.t1
MQGKSWRSWVERKLDETIAGERLGLCCAAGDGEPPGEKQPEWNGVEEAAEAAGEQLEPLEPQVDDEEELLAAFGAPPPEPQQQRQQQRQRVPPGSVRSRRRGTLEQEVFDIVFARDTAVPAAGPHVPPGLPSRYAPLVEAKDAPTLMRGGATHTDSVSPARVHPHRLFYPGQNYSPQDLDPYKGRLRPPTTSEQRARNRRPVVPRTVMERADFRNPKFLSQFVSEGGKLHPRRRTQLRQKLHRHLARQVKIARIMGLMAPDAKVPQHVRASREQA